MQNAWVWGISLKISVETAETGKRRKLCSTCWAHGRPYVWEVNSVLVPITSETFASCHAWIWFGWAGKLFCDITMSLTWRMESRFKRSTCRYWWMWLLKMPKENRREPTHQIFEDDYQWQLKFQHCNTGTQQRKDIQEPVSTDFNYDKYWSIKFLPLEIIGRKIFSIII